MRHDVFSFHQAWEGVTTDNNTIPDLLGAYCALFLALVAAGSFFIFSINWEDWFFGIKLDGWPAGLFLLSKAVVAAMLAFLILRDAKRRILYDVVSVLFFAFVFILPVFSSQRNLRSELGGTIFWIELVVYLIIPVIMLLLYAVVSRIQQGGSYEKSGQ